LHTQLDKVIAELQQALEMRKQYTRLLSHEVRVCALLPTETLPGP